MKLSKLVGERFKERPAECAADSHALMIKGGYMKYVANGIYSQNPILKRVTRKIEEIIRAEMDKIDGQEVLFPVVLPASLWEESGRYDNVGAELLRFEDRNGAKLVLGMTHEEAAVQLVREYGTSYLRYPFMIYQIQTKFRDEARPRAGLIRVREFTMKDAYSFHTSEEDLDAYYQKVFDAYHRIYARAGIGEVVSVASDSGMMGGDLSHEYMLLTPIGEDSIAMCTSCDYRANVESAEQRIENGDAAEADELRLVHTPNERTIEDICRFLQREKREICKAVVYQRKSDDSYVAVFTRGDIDVNETKVKNHIGDEIYPAVITEESKIAAGYIGPFGLTENCQALYDISLKGLPNLVCGANRPEYHYTGFCMERELGDVEYGDFSKVFDGGICPECGKPTLSIRRGIEVGNIFKLGTKYTESMGMQYTDENGALHYPLMGCYGIGVGRLAASVCEAHHDEYGPIWPMSIAPYEVHLCAVRSADEQVRECADSLYEKLLEDGVEVLYDDRKVSAGVMFADADLIGVPVRVIVSPKNLKDGVCEIAARDKSFKMQVPVEDVRAEVEKLVQELKS